MQNQNHRARQKSVSGVILISIIAFGAFLRYYNLRFAPGWYPDEGSDLNIALNLLNGDLRYFAVNGSLLVAARMPLFNLLLALGIRQFGADILVARAIAATAGVLTIPLLYYATRRSLGEWLALGSAAIFAIMPLAVMYNRFAFSYNLQMPLFVIFFWAGLELMETRRALWLLVLSLAAGLALAANLVALPLIAGVAVLGWLYQRRSAAWSVALALAPAAIYFAISYVRAPGAFAQDFDLTVFRSSNTLLNQFIALIIGYTPVLAWDPWILVGVVGLFLIPHTRARVLALGLFFTTLFNILRVQYVAELGLHRILGLMPLVALGVTVFMQRAISFALTRVADDLEIVLARAGWRAERTTAARRWTKMLSVGLIVFLAVGSPLLFYAMWDLGSIGSEFHTRIDYVLARKPSDALATIDFINSNSSPADVVIASPQVGWAMRANVAEVQQTLSLEGYPTDNYPIPLHPKRYVFDASLENARWVVVDNMWREWGVKALSGMPQLLDRVAQWHIAFQRGDFTVYRNPAR